MEHTAKTLLEQLLENSKARAFRVERLEQTTEESEDNTTDSNEEK